jgi:hypothetical protein
VFQRAEENRPDPMVVPGELLRERRGKDLLVVTADYTPDLEANLRQSANLTAVEELNLEDMFVALVDAEKGAAPKETP